MRSFYKLAVVALLTATHTGLTAKSAGATRLCIPSDRLCTDARHFPVCRPRCDEPWIGECVACPWRVADCPPGWRRGECAPD
jgi:hypothetical protein